MVEDMSTYSHEINQVYPLVNHNPIQLPYPKHSLYLVDICVMTLRSIIDATQVCLISDWLRRFKESFCRVVLSHALRRGNEPTPLGINVTSFFSLHFNAFRDHVQSRNRDVWKGIPLLIFVRNPTGLFKYLFKVIPHMCLACNSCLFAFVEVLICSLVWYLPCSLRIARVGIVLELDIRIFTHAC